MSCIDELIRDLSPDGVEYKSLGDVGEFIRGNGLPKTDLRGEGVPAVHYGQLHTFYGVSATETVSFVHEDTAAKLRRAEHGDLLIATTSEDDDAVAKATAWVGDTSVVLSGDAHIYRHTLEPKYVSYFFQSTSFQSQKRRHISGTKMKRISGDSLSAIRIPVPPLEVQREVVRILDRFSQLETELEAELDAELEARRVQHAHYWGALLTPDAGWRRRTLGDVAQVFDGPHATPKKTADGPWYLSISSLKNGRFDFDESAHLDDVDLPKWTRRVASRPGDTLFSYETRLGQAAFWESDVDAALGRRMGLLRPDASMVDPRFLTLVYLGPQFQGIIRAKTVIGSTVDRIPIADMVSWELLLPPLEEQRRIVAVLDRFDALVNDLRSDLGAETLPVETSTCTTAIVFSRSRSSPHE